MSKLASDLGYSIIFPTDCRYCGKGIYLFSSPDGGFAIFDELGIPWPNHECWGIKKNCRDYRANQLYTGRYRLPIPLDCEYPRAPKGNHLIGTSLGRVHDLHGHNHLIWNGSEVVYVFSSLPLAIGRLYRGSVVRKNGAFLLVSPVLIEHEYEKGFSHEFTEDDWGVHEVWYLQQDMAELDISERNIEKLLKIAIDGIVTENELISGLALLNVIENISFTLTQERKLFYSELADQILEYYGFKTWRVGQRDFQKDDVQSAMAHMNSLLEHAKSFLDNIETRYGLSPTDLKLPIEGRLKRC